MCDYSLHNVASRPAKIGDRLVSLAFPNALTRGFAASNEPGVAVCLLPGTELAFDCDVEGYLEHSDRAIRKFGQRLARFRKINLDNPVAHHDALEFAGGETVLVANLRDGQRATVLQLPASARGMRSEPAEAAAQTDDMLAASDS